MTQILPHMVFSGTGYREPPFTDPDTRQSFKDALRTMMSVTGMNHPGQNALAGDDLMVWFRNCGFTFDPAFVAAFAPYGDSKLLRARLWRVYTLCWAARSCRSVEGEHLDFGCYNGAVTDVMQRYAGGKWRAYDVFDHHPAWYSKPDHGPDLLPKVEALFAGRNVRVVPGLLPASLLADLPERIAFAQVDLNSADTEIAVLEAIYPRLSVGGMIVLDDYGFSHYRASYDAEKRFFEDRGEFVYECPTGQGIVVKRQSAPVVYESSCSASMDAAFERRPR